MRFLSLPARIQDLSSCDSRAKEAARSAKMVEGSLLENFKSRFPWLVAVLFGGLLAGSIMGRFQDMLESTLVLAFFIPVIMDMGGNVGTQASTIFVRGMGLGHIRLDQFGYHLRREALLGLCIGAISGLLAGLAAYLWQGEWIIGIVVFISMTITCALASFIGYLIPCVMHLLGQDPATTAGPIVTTIKDISGLLIYFSVARILLELLL
ncbi:MAG: magnesium transporter [Limnochordia bacterium]|jgi:magnesium transporter